VKSWLRKGCLAGAWVAALGLVLALAFGGMFLVQHASEEPVEQSLSQRVRLAPAGGAAAPTGARPGPPTRGSVPGKVLLSLSSAAVTVEAGPAGEPIRVESTFDPDVFRLGQQYEEDEAGRWLYRLDFHERTVLHVSVVGVWLGKRSPEVRIVLPRDLPFALEARMRGGYLTLDLAGLDLITTDIKLDRGVLAVDVSQPLQAPMERLRLVGRMGTMQLASLGNASPRTLLVRHGIGFAAVDLGGEWRDDADVDVQVAFASGTLRPPRNGRVEGLGTGVAGLAGASAEETPGPTVRIRTHFDMGDIKVVE